MKSTLVYIALVAVCIPLLHAQDAVPAKVSDEFHQVLVKNVKIEGEIGRRLDVTMDNNIKKLHLDKNFTDHFKAKTGPEVVGAFIGMGMLIDASVRLAAYSHDPKMIEIKNEIVDKVIDEQLKNGYSGFYKPERRLWNSQGGGDNWDIHEMAFIIDGLTSDYELFGNKRSLKAAIKTADFIMEHWHEMPDDYAAEVDMHVLDTGIDWAIFRLYKTTGEKRFLNFSEKTKSLYQWDTKIEIGRRPGVSGHMFAYFAMCMAQIELYRYTGNKELLQQTENAMRFFLAEDGLTITGSAGQREIWTDDQDGENELGETCATAYQTRVYESLLRLTGKAEYGDLIERTVYNGLFGAQSPDGEKLRYYTPFEGERHYYDVEYMCCPGNFRRIISELPGMVYYRSKEDGVAVNLYAQSEAKLELDNGITVDLQQKTSYPTSGRVELSVSPNKASTFPLSLRIPSWAKEATITVNGEKWPGEIKPGTFVNITREWTSKDQVVLDFPMDIRFIKGRKRNSGRVALMRGPIIYGLNLDKNPEATANGKRSFYDLRRILLDPSTLSGPESDDSVRPDGTALFISGWRENNSGKADRKHEFRLKLTEFPDPDNEFIYFKIPDYSIEVEDELVDKSGNYLNVD
ncbi:beta-L-arabinofuranosidase domain-containing protein [Zobellia uliginosa]|uniref:beta-L-arabinofuranosidase domain-containing protein n=1 Tax=Zobellia uliginosa TaxID=143224 RepID=UPI0026E374B3|nr:beta-L-arabinofuranosidase domain-containing protein [Zobellia uliginosa]MDO6518123.1 glycoside hydrolase family 127 protein [Zobellia uliginosa]